MLSLYGVTLECRLLLGTARYPSPTHLRAAIEASGTEVITVSLRRETANGGAGQDFWSLLAGLGCRILPNTAGCHTPREAITTAQMAREIFGTDWIKLEVIANTQTLQPDVFGLVDAARTLCAEGFSVFPYTTEDLGVAERLLEAGCEVLMPWGAPIGSGQGLRNPQGLAEMRRWFPDTAIIVDAGIGRPSQAVCAMEMGMDAVLLNTAVAKAGDPVVMARAFAEATAAGRLAFEADPMEPRDIAVASSPTVDMAVL